MYEVNSIFNLSCGVRPIKAFHPSALLQPDKDTLRLYLDSDAKSLWFHQYCAENGIQGKIDCTHTASKDLAQIQELSLQIGGRQNAHLPYELNQPTSAGGADAILPGVPCSEFESGFATLVKEFWTAIVYMDGKEVAKADASGTYVVNDRIERDTASNQLRKKAIGAALSQAGFGTISAFDMSEADIAKLAAAGVITNTVPANTGNPVLPPSNSVPPATAPVMQNPFFTEQQQVIPQVVAPAQPQQAPQFTAPAQPSQGLIPAINPVAQPMNELEAAKAMVWPGAGPSQGKTLGMILSENKRNLAWIAKNFTPKNEQDRALQAAARLIIQSLEMGK